MKTGFDQGAGARGRSFRPIGRLRNGKAPVSAGSSASAQRRGREFHFGEGGRAASDGDCCMQLTAIRGFAGPSRPPSHEEGAAGPSAAPGRCAKAESPTESRPSAGDPDRGIMTFCGRMAMKREDVAGILRHHCAASKRWRERGRCGRPRRPQARQRPQAEPSRDPRPAARNLHQSPRAGMQLQAARQPRTWRSLNPPAPRRLVEVS